MPNVPPGREKKYRPHPFSWVPAEGQRHASSDQRPAGGWPDDTEVTTLCSQQVRAATGDLAWLWPTCAACNTEARKLAGFPAAGLR
ncbi:hypothetical protein LZ318_23130 [Saccharopolyspora indica]|uniref:zinc finger protein n=1 Tax=Saccharopolyspora indica TaxID=1229659 RepID=UPI0022EB7EC4|nr:zinc finger protein [Saccharopolyspora indica]MDA3644529.1 hypothetical protein [Saccharopolyspora indica]